MNRVKKLNLMPKNKSNNYQKFINNMLNVSKANNGDLLHLAGQGEEEKLT